MKRKILSVLLALALCLSLALPICATSDTAFVVDDFGNLTDNQLAQLNSIAADIYESSGVGIFFVYTTDDVLADYDVAGLVGDITDYFVMIENYDRWYTFAGGKGETIDDAAIEALRGIYDQDSTYMGGVEAFLRAAAQYFPGSTDSDTEPVAGDAGEELVYDEADLLSDSEETALNEKLLNVSQEYGAQILVVTISDMGGGDIDGYIEYLYDTMNFGYGANHDGVLLLVAMDIREYRILSNGLAGDAIGSGDIDVIGSAIETDLSDGDYSGAFGEFADRCAYYLDGHINGFPFNFGKNLLIALVVGILIGLIVAFILKGQLKSVRKQDRANVYMKPGSMQITIQNDLFLYSDVSRTKKQTSSSSNSGSSRNVGGGSF